MAECSSLGVVNSETKLSHVSAIADQVNDKDSWGEPSPVFGMRKQHRCFVVTARARSFLYHQVGISRVLYRVHLSFLVRSTFTLVNFSTENIYLVSGFAVTTPGCC